MLVTMTWLKLCDSEHSLAVHCMAFRGGSAAAAPAARERSRSARANKQKDLGIDLTIALQTGIGICHDFTKKNYNSCRERQKCRLLHVKGTRLYQNAGLELAKQIANDAAIAHILIRVCIRIWAKREAIRASIILMLE